MRCFSLRGLAAGLATLATLSFTAAAHAQIFTENFNSVPNGTPVAPTTVGGFSLTAGSVDVLGEGFFPGVDTGRGNYLDLDGSGGGLIQTGPLSLSAGTVTLEFQLAGTQRGQTEAVIVSLGSLTTFTSVRNSGDPFALVTVVIPVPVDQTAVLSFDSTASTDFVGLLLDDVTLTQTSVVGAAAPEASTAALASMSLLSVTGITAVRQRRRK
jgi:hypothetical protein